MPQRTKKDHKCSHHSERGSRWHNFHFSGKVIICSVILGFMLILVGGILMAIGMDRDEDTKSDKYDDLRKKPPMVFVGPAIMGIGGFAVVVGVLMCLVETKVCRKRNPDSSPLINAEGEQTEVKEVDTAVNDSDATAIPSMSRHHRDKHRNGAHKKSPSPRKSKGSKKPHSSRDKNQSKSPPSPSEAGGSKSPKFLTASDTFMTPPSSFTDDDPATKEKQREKDNQATTSLMQSFTSSGKSWNTSTEFQTPTASFADDPLSLQFMDRKEEEEMSSKENHKFVTPLNSDAGILSTPVINQEGRIGGNRQPNDDLASSQQNVQDIIISSETTAPVRKTEDSGEESNPPDSQGKPGASEIPSREKSCSSDGTEQTGENPNHLITLQSETDKNASLSEGTVSGTASSENNENHLKDNAADVDELVNQNTEENMSDSIKDESTTNVEADSKETSSSNAASDSSNSGKTTEDVSHLNYMESESTKEHLEETSEIAAMSSDVDAPVETVDAPVKTVDTPT